MRSTDVKHSIAGFYYQVLLACKELILLLNRSKSEESYVAVEYGADVRIFDEQDIRMEAKFYNDNTFTRYKEAITHSIYNFFNSFKDSSANVKYRFKCNVPVNIKDLQFFTNWVKPTEISEKIKYIKECFVYESVGQSPIKEGEYKNFKTYYDTTTNSKEKKHYKQALIKYLDHHPNSTEYTKYIIPSMNVDDSVLESFIKQIEFIFPPNKVSKFESIDSLKRVIDRELAEYNKSLTVEERSKIMLLLLEAFFDSTIDSNMRTIKISDCKKIITNYQALTLTHLDNEENLELIKEIEQELADYEYILREHGYAEFIDDIMVVLISLKEQLHSEINQFGAKTILKRFIMSNRPYPLEVIKLFQFISELMIKTKRGGQVASIIDIDSINNLKIGDSLHLSLRALPAASSARSNAKLIINYFIDHTQENLEISKATGGETIVFDTDSDVCQLELEDINNTIIDIRRVKDNKQHQEMYKSFRYKCFKCMKLSYCDACSFLKELEEGE
ncbi:hypothetical protein [Paenibacillus sp. Mc5Re-14]|uniref:hypothetical protein n=1 Tax=Paenibacillus sp. Mc5Re-14 TaxID=1030529 RepID=UPI000B1232FA|nr:hypothetical protein [Paenibacillus sp. Mc5Re-14]